MSRNRVAGESRERTDATPTRERDQLRVLNLVTNGDAQFFEQQVGSLAALGVRNRTVPVPGRRTADDEATESRSPLDYVRFYPRVLRRSIEDYDLVHANYGLTGPAALAQPIRPVVLTLWGSDLFGGVGWLSRLCARRADAVIVMSEGMADALGPVDCHVIPHGVDLERFRPMPREAARERVGWDADAAQVLFPYPQSKAVKNYPRARSVVRAAGRRVDGPVELQTLHGVPHDDMPLYLNAADALVLTSEREGSPNSVKEAMACNLPVVSTDVGDVSDRLDGVSRSHVCDTDAEFVDALVDVLDSPGPSDGRRHVEALGLERMAERIRSVYDSVR